jgi:hypothetical protein
MPKGSFLLQYEEQPETVLNPLDALRTQTGTKTREESDQDRATMHLATYTTNEEKGLPADQDAAAGTFFAIPR